MAFGLLVIVGIKCNAQTTVIGELKTKKGVPVMFANIAIKGSFDGASSNANGEYSFVTSEKGEQIIMVSCIGYQAIEKPVIIDKPTIQIDFILEPAVNELDAVYITAG